MSSEIIEAVFRFSHYHRKQLMLIASKNQIDHSGGYVNNWNTAQYAAFIAEIKKIYPMSDVKICRDHCGPGFNGIDEIADCYKTIEDDIKNGFDLMHIDFCHFKGDKGQQLEETKKAIEYCLKLRPDIYLEIGTDENYGANYNLPILEEIARELDYFKNFCVPEFYVVQTGTVVKEIGQAGHINKEAVEQISAILKSKDVKLKEHNADYLSKDEIVSRRGIVDAVNIAPQLGVVQTKIVLSKCLIYGIDPSEFLEEVYKKGKWKKWMDKNTMENKLLCCEIAGHYHFASDSYKKIILKLAEREEIKENLISVASDIISHYLT
ncbi:MAG: hypothetical protein V1902_02940 [Candidatus Falkowbacteria bacterium]